MARVDDVTERLEAAGWTVDGDALGALEAKIELDDPDAVQLLVNTMRLRLLASLTRSPASVKELAVRFDVPPTRLYHHIDLLEGIGAVGVVGTRRSGARTERCYAGARGGVGFHPDLLQGDLEQLADAVAGLAALGGEAAAAAVRAGRLDLHDDEPEGFLSLSLGRLTPDQRRTVADELTALIERIADWSDANEAAPDDAESTMLLLVAVPDVTFDAPG